MTRLKLHNVKRWCRKTVTRCNVETLSTLEREAMKQYNVTKLKARYVDAVKTYNRETCMT